MLSSRSVTLRLDHWNKVQSSGESSEVGSQSEEVLSKENSKGDYESSMSQAGLKFQFPKRLENRKEQALAHARTQERVAELALKFRKAGKRARRSRRRAHERWRRRI